MATLRPLFVRTLKTVEKEPENATGRLRPSRSTCAPASFGSVM